MIIIRLSRIFLLLLIFIALRVDAGIYKWLDSEGNVQYGDRPVDANQATELTINMDADTGVSHSSGDDKERNLMIRELQEDRQAREKAREDQLHEQQQRRERCARFKSMLSRQQRANSLYKKDANGERVYYSQAERDAREKKLNQGISKNCR